MYIAFLATGYGDRGFRRDLKNESSQNRILSTTYRSQKLLDWHEKNTVMKGLTWNSAFYNSQLRMLTQFSVINSKPKVGEQKERGTRMTHPKLRRSRNESSWSLRMIAWAGSGGDVIGGRSGDELQENVEIASFLTLHNSLAIAARGTFLNT